MLLRAAVQSGDYDDYWIPRGRGVHAHPLCEVQGQSAEDAPRAESLSHHPLSGSLVSFSHSTACERGPEPAKRIAPRGWRVTLIILTSVRTTSMPSPGSG